MTEHTPEPVYEPMRPPPRELKPGWRKAGRVLWIAFFSVLGFVVLAVVTALVWLQTGTGTEELGRFARPVGWSRLLSPAGGSGWSSGHGGRCATGRGA